MIGRQRVIIENVKPEINHGQFPIKRVVGDHVIVSADIFSDSHDVISAELVYKHLSATAWTHVEPDHLVNDHWEGSFITQKKGIYFYTIQAWVDRFKTWHRDMLKKIDAEVDYTVDLLEGAEIIQRAMDEHTDMERQDKNYLDDAKTVLRSDAALEERINPITTGELFDVMTSYPVRSHLTRYKNELTIMVERKKAGYSTWYELFPRSTASEPGMHGTLRTTAEKLPYVAEMGFDVLYLPPIHPIGNAHRKGKNNTVTCEPGDPGSPWAIGSQEGGHKAIHPELGNFDDFDFLLKEAEKHNIEVALDIAFQCSPDHPYVKEHPGWFRERPDGSIQYAENPPKKYQDIYPFDFETKDAEGMWEELKSIFIFWIEKGVSIFRVDNPHTKSMRFWGWVITEIKRDYPDTIFLSEAFTRPKVMYQLAKQGFTQSYTYFTWRNTKYELTKYFEELTQTEAVEFFRPNAWPNTPDILPEFLQVSGRSGYIIRNVLAATLCASYGIYGPAFELMDNVPKTPGSEEYLNSEKYEIKDWNINDSKSLKPVISRINQIRNTNKALHSNYSLTFHTIHNENMICYSKHTPDFSNIVLVVVNLDPYHTHHGWVDLNLDALEMDTEHSFQVHDMLGGAYFLWHGAHNYVELNPGIMPAHIFILRRKVRTERDFDYYM
ncbi:MAG: DUF3416 domain-containing protein [Bacteroidetes bacterium]|jgi:starch synthase (maltosyl-transferring)|nr:DUF3416 domain-containing protein [Bacteroidota bacterium]